MPVREHEAIAVRPQRIGRIVTQKSLPQRVSNRREPHRRARMPGIRLLHRINRQRADGIDAEKVQVYLSFRLTHVSSPAVGPAMEGCPLRFFDTSLMLAGANRVGILC